MTYPEIGRELAEKKVLTEELEDKDCKSSRRIQRQEQVLVWQMQKKYRHG